MYKELNEDLFAAMLKKVLYENMEKELNALPCEDEIRKLFPYTKKQNREARLLRRIIKQRTEKISYIYLKRAAVIFLCVITASFGLMLTDNGIRAEVGEKLRKIAEVILPWSYKAEPEDIIKEHNTEKGYYELSFDDIPVADREAALEQFSIENVEITYIPEGFERYNAIEDESTRIYSYQNSKDNYLSISIYTVGIADFTLDSDRTSKEKIYVNENDALLFFNEKECSGSIYWGNEIYTIRIYGQISRAELIMIAEGIKY